MLAISRTTPFARVVLPARRSFLGLARGTRWPHSALGADPARPDTLLPRGVRPRSGHGVPALVPSFLIGAGSCRGRSESRWSARSAARTYDLDCDLCTAAQCPARGGRPSHWCRCGHRRVRYGGWPGWRRVRGNGGAGSGPRRCAAALEAAGRAARQLRQDSPRSGRPRRGTPRSFSAFPRVLPALTAQRLAGAGWPGAPKACP